MKINNKAMAAAGFAAMLTLALPVFTFARDSAASLPSLTLNHSIVATFDPSFFAESITLDREGNLYVSLSNFADTCVVLKINPHTKEQRVVASFPSVNTCETSFLLGVAFDERDRLHVIVSLQSPSATDQNGVPGPNPGVYRIEEDGTAVRVLSLPATSFPNGLAFYNGDMYVSDSNLGAIWKKGPKDSIAQTRPWYQDAVLQLSAPPGGLGANGIAFLFDQLYIAVYDAGRVVRVPIRPDGKPPAYHEVLVEDPRLIGMDGIAFDIFGNLWFTVNYSGTNGTDAGGKLGFLDERSRVHVLADTPGPGWLSYPTMVAFGTTFRERGTLYLTNGVTHVNVLAVDVGVRGLPLPAF